jgi:hypothetical protein
MLLHLLLSIFLLAVVANALPIGGVGLTDTLAAGLTGTVSWSGTTNWLIGGLLGGLPGLGDNVQISAAVTLNVDVQANVGDFDFSTADLVILDSDSLSCSSFEWRSGNISMQGSGSFSLSGQGTIFAVTPAATQVMSGGTVNLGSSGSLTASSGAQASFEQCAIAQGTISAQSGAAISYSGASFTATTTVNGAGSHSCSGTITASGSGQLQVAAGTVVDFQAGSSFANTSASAGQSHLVVGADTGSTAAVNVHSGTGTSTAVSMCGTHEIRAQGQISVQSGAQLTYNLQTNTIGKGNVAVASTGQLQVQNSCAWRHAVSNFDFNSQLLVTGQGALTFGNGHTCTISGGQVTGTGVATAGTVAYHVGEDVGAAAQGAGTLNLQGHASGPCGVHGGVIQVHDSGVVQTTAAAAAAAPHVLVDTDTELRGTGKVMIQSTMQTAANLKCNTMQHVVAATGELHVAGAGHVSVGQGSGLSVNSGKLTCDKAYVAGATQETMAVGEDTTSGLTGKGTLQFQGTPAAPCHISDHSINLASQGQMVVATGGALAVDTTTEIHGTGTSTLNGAVNVASGAQLLINHACTVAAGGALMTTGTATAAGKVVVGAGQQLAIQNGGGCGHSGAVVPGQSTLEIGSQGGAASSLNFKAGQAESFISGGVIAVHDQAQVVVESGASVAVKAESTIAAATAGASGKVSVSGVLDAASPCHIQVPTSVTGTLAVNAANACDFADVTFAAAATFAVRSADSGFTAAKSLGTVQAAGTLAVQLSAAYAATSKVQLLSCNSLQGKFSAVTITRGSAAAAPSVAVARPVWQIFSNDYSQCIFYQDNSLWYDPNAASFCAPAVASAESSSNNGATWQGVKTSWLWVIVAVVVVSIIIVALCMRQRKVKKSTKAMDPTLKQPLSPRRPSVPQSTDAVNTQV